MKKRLLAAMMVLGMTLGMAQMPVMAESTELTTEAAAAQTETSATEAAGTEANAEETENPLTAQAVAGQEKIKVLLLPKFEIGTLDDGKVGEGELLYKEYCEGGEAYDIAGSLSGSKLYVKDGVALYVTGMGKVNAATSLTSILNDSRFDFSDTYIISVGCAGSAIEYGTMGDVFIITSAVDYDLGHKADVREMTNSDSETTWYHDASYDGSAFKHLNTALTDQVYEVTKDVKLETTDQTRKFMKDEFDDADWAVRDPKVLKGTTVTGDNYWKGKYDHDNAVLIAKTYDCPDPYATTEMEDVALADVADRYGLLDRFLIIRDSVNTDVFMSGNTPGTLWGDEKAPTGDSAETFDIFPTSMENGYKVTKAAVDAILGGEVK